MTSIEFTHVSSSTKKSHSACSYLREARERHERGVRSAWEMAQGERRRREGREEESRKKAGREEEKRR